MTQGPDMSAVGRAVLDAHTAYRYQRLTFEPPDERISDVVTWASLKPHALRFAVFYAIFLVALPIWMFFQILSGVTNLAEDFSGSDSSGVGGFFGFLSGVMSLLMFGLVVAWFVSLFLPVREQISEYGLLVEDCAPAAAGAYAWVLATSRRRQSPFEIRAVQVMGVPSLRAASERVRALVIVRAVGTDLYLGWSMWRSRSTILILGHLIRDVFRRFSESADVVVDVRSSNARALRELVHSLVREGTQAALLGAPVSPEAQQEINRLPSLESGDNPPNWPPRPPSAPGSSTGPTGPYGS